MSNETRAMTAGHDPHHAGVDLQLPSSPDGMTFDPATGNLAPARANRPGLLHLLHLSLRGRYWFVIPLALIMGAAGAIAGWKLLNPKYQSVGRIQVLYKIPTVNPNEQADFFKQMEMYDESVNTLAAVMKSQQIIDLAMHNDAWVRTGRGNDAEAMKRFVDNLTVEHPPRTESIDVTLIDRDPGVAATGVGAVVTEFTAWYDAREQKIMTTLLGALKQKVEQQKAEITDANRQIDEVVRATGSEDFAMLIQSTEAEFIYRQKQLEALETSLTQLEHNGNPGEFLEKLTLEQIGIVHPPMAERMHVVAAAKNAVRQAKAAYGENHPTVRAAEANYEAALQDAKDYAEQWRQMQKMLSMRGASATGSSATPTPAPTTESSQQIGSAILHGGTNADGAKSASSATGTAAAAGSNEGLQLGSTPDALRQQIAQCRDLIERKLDQMKVYSLKQREVQKYKDRLKGLTTDLADSQAEMANLRNDYERGVGRLIVLSAGDIPIQPYKDPRKPAAAGLGLLGLFLPILIFVMIGLADHRVRFTDQADENSAGLPPLLGILPTLPDKLNDPEPAAVAAHCVHQLRIMLQVSTANGTGPDGQPVTQRKAYVITSASPGDGKTSLTMALGLSFAASGSRTLVIDCDMVGQGLTNRLKAGGSPGLLEALQAGTLAGRVKKTTTPNLYVLPIGQAESAHAGALSPQSVRRLLIEARKIFDVVVIDTGPILGSLEAQVLSAAADSVILTVSRGQQQPLLQKALRMLRQIGAHVGGMVFNRAQQKDFEKSVTSSSIKSVGHATPTRRELLEEGAEGSRFGPLARSVASFMPTNRDIPVPPPQTSKPVASTATPAAATSSNEIRVEVVSRPAKPAVADDTVYGANGDGDSDNNGNPQ